MEPITLAELKAHARIASADTGQDSLISDYIAAARDQFELRADCGLMSQGWQLKLPSLIAGQLVWLPKAPLASVESITCETETGPVAVPITDYVIIPGGYSPGRVAILPDAQLPTPKPGYPFPWLIKYTVGVVDPADLWPGVKGAILLLAAFFYDHRETAGPKVEEKPHAFEAVVAQYRSYVP